MAICGYNEKIGLGLNALIEGMASSMEEKALKVGAINALDYELYELQEMIMAMEGKGPIQEIFVGLNIFAQKLFIEVKKELEANPEKTVTSVMEDIRLKFVCTIKSAEAFRESLDEPALIRNNKVPIKVLAEWVNENAAGF